MKLPTITKTVRQDDLLPRFYGVAWVRWSSNSTVCLPVPLNIIASIACAAWIFLKHGGRSLYMNPRSAYEQGLRDGARSLTLVYWTSVREKPIPAFQRVLVQDDCSCAMAWKDGPNGKLYYLQQESRVPELVKWAPVAWMLVP